MTVSLGVNKFATWTPYVTDASDLIPGSNFTVELNNTLNRWQGPLYIGTPE